MQTTVPALSFIWGHWASSLPQSQKRNSAFKLKTQKEKLGSLILSLNQDGGLRAKESGFSEGEGCGLLSDIPRFISTPPPPRPGSVGSRPLVPSLLHSDGSQPESVFETWRQILA